MGVSMQTPTKLLNNDIPQKALLYIIGLGVSIFMLFFVIIGCSVNELDQRGQKNDDFADADEVVVPAEVSGSYLTFENSDVECEQKSTSELFHTILCQLVIVNDDGSTEKPLGAEIGLIINWENILTGSDAIQSQECKVSDDLLTFECDIETTTGNVSLNSNVILEKSSEEKLITYSQSRDSDGQWTGNSETKTLAPTLGPIASVSSLNNPTWSNNIDIWDLKNNGVYNGGYFRDEGTPQDVFSTDSASRMYRAGDMYTWISFKWSAETPVKVGKKIRVRAGFSIGAQLGELLVNNSVIGEFSNGDNNPNWSPEFTFSGTIQSLELRQKNQEPTDTDGFGNRKTFGVGAIEVDGVILVDNDTYKTFNLPSISSDYVIGATIKAVDSEGNDLNISGVIADINGNQITVRNNSEWEVGQYIELIQ